MAFNLKRWFTGFLLILAVIGPGIITSNVDNDAGGIATYSLAGADFGYALLWILIPVLVLLIIVQEMCARLGVVTGKGLADLIRENFSLRMTFFIMALLVIVNVANTISEFAGVAAAAEIFGISRYIAVPLAGIFVWYLIVKGNYKSVEKIFLFACLFYVAYIISGFIAKPVWAEVARNSFVPTFNFTELFFLTVVGIIGTTIAPWMQFYLQSSIVEKGIKKEEYKYSKIDVIFGSFLAVVVAFFIILTTAATIHAHGIKVETASDAAMALLPLAGKYAELLFAFGLLNASLFAASILPLSTAYSVAEAFGWESGVNRKFKEAKNFYLLYGIMIALGVVFVLIPGVSLMQLMWFSQVLNGILLPFIMVFMLKLINNKELMGEYVNSKFYNMIAWGSSILIIAITMVMLYLMLF